MHRTTPNLTLGAGRGHLVLASGFVQENPGAHWGLGAFIVVVAIKAQSVLGGGVITLVVDNEVGEPFCCLVLLDFTGVARDNAANTPPHSCPSVKDVAVHEGGGGGVVLADLKVLVGEEIAIRDGKAGREREGDRGDARVVVFVLVGGGVLAFFRLAGG